MAVGRADRVYSPADPVFTLRVKPVLGDTTVTLAPATTALLASVTVPLISARVGLAKWPRPNSGAEY